MDVPEVSRQNLGMRVEKCLRDSNDNLESTVDSERVELVKIVYLGVLVECRVIFGLNRDHSGAFWSLYNYGKEDLRIL